MEIDPLFVDRHVAKHLLGGIGDTKLYEYVNSGDIVRRYHGNKAVFSFASIKSLADRLSDQPSEALKKRNSNLKYCGDER